MPRKSARVKLNCLECGKEFLQRPAELTRVKSHGRNTGRFCSRACCGKHRSEHTPKLEDNCKCAVCGKTFYRNSYRRNKPHSGLSFCSRQCKDKGQSFECNFPKMRPKKYKNGYSMYRKHALRRHGAKCAECGFAVAHILVVHHKDGDRNNNNIENLEVLCPNHHALRHCSGGRYCTSFIAKKV